MDCRLFGRNAYVADGFHRYRLAPLSVTLCPGSIRRIRLLPFIELGHVLSLRSPARRYLCIVRNRIADTRRDHRNTNPPRRPFTYPRRSSNTRESATPGGESAGQCLHRKSSTSIRSLPDWSNCV